MPSISAISVGLIDYFKSELAIVSKDTGKPISTPGEIAELVKSERGLQATENGITHGDKGLTENLYRAILGLKQPDLLKEAETAEVFSAKAQALYEAIIDNEWDPMILNSPEAIAKLVEQDKRLASHKTGNKKEDEKLFDETFHYAIFVAAKDLMGAPENDEYQMRSNSLTKQELIDFRTEFLRRLEADVKPELLDDKDVRKAVENNVVLRELVASLTDGNEDLVTTLYTETVAWIQAHNGCL